MVFSLNTVIKIVRELIVIRRRVHVDVRHGAQERGIEHTLVRLAVFADHAGSVHGQNNFEMLQGAVVDELVVRAL